jgi:hypothetical protein
MIIYDKVWFNLRFIIFLMHLKNINHTADRTLLLIYNKLRYNRYSTFARVNFVYIFCIQIINF